LWVQALQLLEQAFQRLVQLLEQAFQRLVQLLVFVRQVHLRHRYLR
jgi:hypothetical protein